MSTPQPGPLAVVTGASPGIGKAYADRLAAQGHALLLVARRQDRLTEVAADLASRHGVPVDTLVADLEQPADLAVLEQRLASEPVAALVNNAGAGGLGPTAKSTADKMESLIRLNIVALTRLSHAALVGFRARGAGTLVNIGSIIAFAPSKGGAVYSGSKAYVLNFTRSLQMKYAKTGLSIQVVMPGPIRTEFFSSQELSDGIFPTRASSPPSNWWMWPLPGWLLVSWSPRPRSATAASGRAWKLNAAATWPR
jgi:short-subunit dehydrogenase